MGTLVLGIETSCDECSAAIVRLDRERATVLGLSTYSQVRIHQPYGGVVPEIASRNHLETVNDMIAQATSSSNVSLSELDAVAVTNRPGLIGALLVGVSAAKALSYALQKPLVPVHHLEGHALSPFLEMDRSAREAIQYPLLIAIVSGGHTNLYVIHHPPELWPLDVLKKSLVGRSRDDAAGEAFDKTAKLMGFPYPGGAYIDKNAEGGNRDAFDFPRALPQRSHYDFSFSGLKTAVALKIEELKKKGEFEKRLPDLCASVQEAIVSALVAKIELAMKDHGCRTLSIVGGVAANSRLREAFAHRNLILPRREYCTDNAAMIAMAGGVRLLQGHGVRDEVMLSVAALANPEI